jgi:L-lactate dehydrogenase complex protein LldE
MQIDLFVPCFVDQIYPETAFNAIKVLEKLGCEVHYNENQTCCGQPAFNAGYWEEAKAVGEKCLRDFPNNRPLVVLSSSCTGMMRNYYHDLFHNSAVHNQFKQLQRNTYEFSEFIFKFLDISKLPAVFEHTVTYHDACSALRECSIYPEPRQLLKQVRGLKLIEIKDSTVCCGFGGTFSVKNEAISVAMAEQKVQCAVDTDAEILVSADLSCLMQLDGYIKKNGIKLKTMHIADVLANGWGEIA